MLEFNLYTKLRFFFSHIFDYCTNTKYGNDQADLYEYLRNYLRNYLENLCQVNQYFIYFYI